MIEVCIADYGNLDHGKAIITLLDMYGRDPMGGSEPLEASVRHGLIGALSKRNDALSLLAYAQGKPVGLLNAFEGFSTFACKALLNIHDVVVDPLYRGQGISRALFEEAERIARERGYVKMTLEVLQGNDVARTAYTRFGFQPYELGRAGFAEFWQKSL